MGGVVEREFEKIINDALGKADAVKCDAVDYRENLKAWIYEIKLRITASEQSDDE